MLDEDPEHGYSRSLFWQMSRLTEEKGCLSFDDRVDALAIAVGFFVEAAAQDRQNQQRARSDALRAEAVASWLQGTEADIDCLALGWRAPKTAGAVHGGVKRLSVGG